MNIKNTTEQTVRRSNITNITDGNAVALGYIKTIEKIIF